MHSASPHTTHAAQAGVATRPRPASARASARAGAPCRGARGLTIVEIIVVIILIALLAGLAIPRMGGMAARRAEGEAQAVRGLLTAAAQRDAMSSDAYAVAYDSASGRLGLLILRPSSKPGEAPQWLQAPLQTPIELSASEIRGVSIDGRAAGGSWTVELRPSQPRPAISILLAPRDALDRSGWAIELGPTKLAAELQPLGDVGAWSPVGADVEDLDAEGLREESW